jgi:hypothetical protein
MAYTMNLSLKYCFLTIVFLLVETCQESACYAEYEECIGLLEFGIFAWSINTGSDEKLE